MNIMFDDLTAEMQACILQTFGIESPAEMNWDVNPLFYLPIPSED